MITPPSFVCTAPLTVVPPSPAGMASVEVPRTVPSAVSRVRNAPVPIEPVGAVVSPARSKVPDAVRMGRSARAATVSVRRPPVPNAGSSWPVAVKPRSWTRYGYALPGVPVVATTILPAAVRTAVPTVGAAFGQGVSEPKPAIVPPALSRPVTMVRPWVLVVVAVLPITARFPPLGSTAAPTARSPGKVRDATPSPAKPASGVPGAAAEAAAGTPRTRSAAGRRAGRRRAGGGGRLRGGGGPRPGRGPLPRAGRRQKATAGKGIGRRGRG